MGKPNVNESIKQNYELVARAPTTEKVGQVTTIRHAIAIDVARRDALRNGFDAAERVPLGVAAIRVDRTHRDTTLGVFTRGRVVRCETIARGR